MNSKNSTKKSQTDWARIDQMTDEDIDFTDLPEITDEMWGKGVLQKGLKTDSPKPQQILTVDSDIIEFFKARGLDYQTKINELLRAYVKFHQIK
jgi:uncharacterized protein (DUF4415 family)